ncbi:MAG: hypothetical protein GY943_15375 [Chloroflexi bacterium]|nr:hypothetical protein [Chloroflexota bacterium]
MDGKQKNYYSKAQNRILMIVPVGIITMVFTRPIIKKVFTAHSTNTLVYSDALIPLGKSIAILAIITITYFILERLKYLQNVVLLITFQILLGVTAGITGATLFLVLFTFFVS